MPYPTNLPIKMWRVEERPREKLSNKGVEACTEAELLAMILRTGQKGCSAIDQARNLLDQFSNLSRLACASLEELILIQGIGKAKATAILSAFELSRRIDLDNGHKKTFFTSSISYRYLRRKIGHRSQEIFYALFFDNGMELIGEYEINKGGITSSQVDQRILFKEALLRCSPKIIIGHNHPSGVLKPSMADDHLTRRIIQCANLFDISVMDHIIVGPRKGYYSYLDAGRMPILTV